MRTSGEMPLGMANFTNEQLNDRRREKTLRFIDIQ